MCLKGIREFLANIGLVLKGSLTFLLIQSLRLVVAFEKPKMWAMSCADI